MKLSGCFYDRDNKSMRDIELALKPISSYQTKAYGSPVNSFKKLFIYSALKLKTKFLRRRTLLCPKTKNLLILSSKR